jgi:chemotaxis protein MotB
MKRRKESDSLLTENEEENYFVSLSDLMTGVLFVFVILTTALALHYHLEAGKLAKAEKGAQKAQGEAGKAKEEAEKERGKAKAARDEANRERGKAEQVQEALDALAKVLREREQLRKEELQRLVSRLGAQNLNVELDETNGILRLPEELLFRTSEAELQPEGHLAIALLAKEMLPVARKGCGDSPLKWEAIYIEGHTDNIPIKTTEFPSNWQLSSSRAISTFNALILSQPDLHTLLNHQQKAVMGISGYGENRPVADNATEEGRQKNRRIDIRFVMAYPSQAEIAEMERTLRKATETMGAAKP